MSKDLAMALNIKKKSGSGMSSEASDERLARLKQKLFGRGEPMSEDPAEDQMAEDMMGKDDFLSADDDDDVLMMAEGGEVPAAAVEHNSGRKSRLKGILSENHMKSFKK